MDREKVIKWLDVCKTADRAVGLKEDYPCRECPYKDSSRCMRELVADALAILKEQEHKDRMFNALEEDWKRLKAMLKEQQEEIVPYIDIDEAKCPDCKVKLTRQELLGDDVLFEDFYDYCPHCGKKVKWE